MGFYFLQDKPKFFSICGPYMTRVLWSPASKTYVKKTNTFSLKSIEANKLWHAIKYTRNCMFSG